MKTKPTNIHSSLLGNGADSPPQGAVPPHANRRSGVALLIVLGMLVLLSVMVLAFITNVTTDLGDSKGYEAQVTTRMLADSAIDLVIGDIRAASTGADTAWISQPGLLRTYDANGNAVAAYKLYSASQMVVAGAFDPNAGTDLPAAGWLNQPNLWTDINSPIASGTTSTGAVNYIFPIIDGNGIASVKTSGSNQLAYTSDNVIPSIEGFATNPAQVGITYTGSNTLSATTSPVPMPVQWLYMLKDGSLISGSAVAGSRDVKFNGTIAPSGTNPIVARIAFWTDDESCKLNVNTASEGTFWDSMVCNTQPFVADPYGSDPVGNAVFDPNQIYESDLAERQCDQNEYQRYPGHPATTCLSPVLGDAIFKGLNFTTGKSVTGYGTSYGYHTLTGTSWATFCEFINQLTPRVSGYDLSGTLAADYSSKAGTYRPGGTSLMDTTGATTSMGSGTWVTPDQDRLYVTVDDYFYSGTIPAGAANTTRFNNSGPLFPGKTSGTYATPVLTPALLEKARFFLTADSKSPELNVWNMPRVCMWPVTKNQATLNNPDTSLSAVTSTMTPFDKVIAFCATVGGTSSGLAGRTPFYFTRYDPFNQSNDFTNTGGSPNGTNNNLLLYKYLQNFMNQPVPGFSSGGATFKTKYPSEDLGTVTLGGNSGGNQILTEICDYIRCTNLADCSQDVLGTLPYGTTSYTMVNPTSYWYDTNWNSMTSQGQVVPLSVGATRGIGRIAIPGELTMVILKVDDRINNGDNDMAPESTITVTGTTTYTGTWTFVPAKKPNNYANVLLAETSGSHSVYTTYATGKTPPSTDILLTPGTGGFAVSGTNTYDPRKQTKIQLALVPYYFCPMAGYSALANNIRYHFENVNIKITSSGSTVTAVAPSGTAGSSGTFASGTQGSDAYDIGRIDTINQMESKIGGPMGPKSLINAASCTTQPTNPGAPLDSMFPVLEAVVSGTNETTSSSGTSLPTMQISGTAVLDIIAPSGTVPTNSWSQARGVANEVGSTIQTITFVFPGPGTTPSSGTACTVNIPALDSTYSPYVDVLRTGTNTYSGNINTAESMPILAGTSGPNVFKKNLSRMTSGSATWGNGGGNYSNYFQTVGNNDIYRSLQLSGILPKSGMNIAGDFRLVAATANVPGDFYQPIQKYSASGSSPFIGGNYNENGGSNLVPYTSGSPTPYFDPSVQYADGWRTCIFAKNWPDASPPGYLFTSGSTGAITAPVYGDNRYAPYVPAGVMGVYLKDQTGKLQPGDWDNGQGWIVDGAYCNKPDEGWIRHWEAQQNFVTSNIPPVLGQAWDAEDSALGISTLYAPNKLVSSPVMFGSLPTGVLAQNPWQTLLFHPAKSYFPGGAAHPGAAIATSTGKSPGTGVIAYPPYTALPDHLLLDLFWMPVVDPYPISEPFATAGKVNLNYQIAPFTYITRKTALRGVLQSVKITAMNPTIADNITPIEPSGLLNSAGSTPYFSETYKIPGTYHVVSKNGQVGDGGGVGVCIRRNIDIDDTLKEIDYLRFGLPGSTTVNKPFITASEICDVPLIPADLPSISAAAPYNIVTGTIGQSSSPTIQGTPNPANWDSILAGFWYGGSGAQPAFGHRLTGDNSLERPYSMIYPRLTTKSNTYTVHVRVQTLKKAPTTPVNVFKDGQDQVIGEFRGSFVIERYLDPATTGFFNGPTPVSFSSNNGVLPASTQIGPFKFRIVSSKQFGQ